MSTDDKTRDPELIRKEIKNANTGLAQVIEIMRRKLKVKRH